MVGDGCAFHFNRPRISFGAICLTGSLLGVLAGMFSFSLRAHDLSTPDDLSRFRAHGRHYSGAGKAHAMPLALGARNDAAALQFGQEAARSGTFQKNRPQPREELGPSPPHRRCRVSKQGTISDVGSRSADPIKFWLRSQAGKETASAQGEH